MVFNDPHAGEILQDTANNIEKLFNRSTKNRRRYETYDIHHVIEEDGWARMQWQYVLKNGGPGPISMLRYGFDHATSQPISFKDLDLSVECGPEPFEAVALPIENASHGKSFALAFIPPIEPGQSRSVTIRYRSPDFRESVRRKPDLLAEADGLLRSTNERASTPSNSREERENDYTTTYVWRFRDVMAPLHSKIDAISRTAAVTGAVPCGHSTTGARGFGEIPPGPV